MLDRSSKADAAPYRYYGEERNERRDSRAVTEQTGLYSNLYDTNVAFSS